MAAPQQQPSRTVVEFEANQPVEVALKYPTGKPVQGIRGERVMFSLADDRVMFLDLGPAQRINELKPRPGEPIVITMHWSGKKKEPKHWTAALAPEAELRRAKESAHAAGDTWGEKRFQQTLDRREASMQQVGQRQDGTFAVPVIGGTAKLVQTAAPTPQQGWAQHLASVSNELVDVYAIVWKRACERHGTAVQPETVLELVRTAFSAQAARRGSPEVA